MKIEYIDRIEKIDWSSVRSLFDSVGWTGRQEKDIEESFSSSSFVRFAYSNKTLVACGRTVGDSRYYSWIVDLAVLPRFQHSGIGTQILKYLSNDLSKIKNVSLVASSEVENFYRKNGWIKQNDLTMRLER
ncbi:GNAT family N-acetyltransferase [Pelagicoccus sp. NFK12]|uniref:GNAT family N-acetyltransferase n=1 Tax=Pelagicoccus enzymogenes TaxID=2773457 RepID=A0A927IH89_9BACT|nr:GNAT family N-acetyltransferase [Pelagicoccus enzymogenes]